MELGPKQKEWVAALRSGEYKQGKYDLYTPKTNSYCCLGVAAKVVGATIEQMLKGGGYIEAEKQLAMFETEAFWRMNDDQGLTFEQIADRIEAHPHHYFKESK